MMVTGTCKPVFWLTAFTTVISDPLLPTMVLLILDQLLPVVTAMVGAGDGGGGGAGWWAAAKEVERAKAADASRSFFIERPHNSEA